MYKPTDLRINKRDKLKKNKVKHDKRSASRTKMFKFTKVIGLENIEFGDYVILDDYVLIYAKSKMRIGNYVHIASFTSITGGGEFIIEDYCAISSGCRMVTGTDDFKNSGFGNSTIANEFRNLKIEKIHIKKFAIIGANSVVLPGITIGEGASVGAGSVVTKDLAPWGIYIGNKRIGERNKEEVLKNYETFCSLSEKDKVGLLFQNDV